LSIKNEALQKKKDQKSHLSLLWKGDEKTEGQIHLSPMPFRAEGGYSDF